MGTNTAISLLNFGTTAYYFMLGAISSGYVFSKLSHVVEYTLHKKFGDYTNLYEVEDPQRMLERVFIVSMGPQNDYYYTQNIVLAMLIGCIFKIAIQLLALAGCPPKVTLPLLVGSIAAPILCGLVNMILRGTRVAQILRLPSGFSNYPKGRWVLITDQEALIRGIDPNSITKIDGGERGFYRDFGSAPYH